MIIHGREVATNLIIYVVGLLLLVGAVSFGLSQCSKRKVAGKTATVATGQAGAATDTGWVAINTMEGYAASAAETDEAVDDGKAAVRAAPEAERGRVTVNSACRMRTYRDTPECAVLRKGAK